MQLNFEEQATQLCDRIQWLERLAFAQTRLAETDLDIDRFMRVLIAELERLV
jgi:hypothetical protein